MLLSVSGRTVLGVWFAGSLILGALYGGSLTSKLSLHKSPKPADSLKELLKRHPNAMLALKNSSQIHDYFKVSRLIVISVMSYAKDWDTFSTKDRIIVFVMKKFSIAQL